MVYNTVIMKPVDLTKLLKPYKSGWVALSRNYKKVIASAPTLEKMDNKLKKLGNPDIVLISASENYKGFVT